MKWKTWFQAFAFHKCDSYRYGLLSREKQRKLASARIAALNESIHMQKQLVGKIGRVAEMLEKTQDLRWGCTS